MNQVELEQMIPRYMHELLALMFATWRRWQPKIGYPCHSAGMESGGSVSSVSDMDDDAIAYGVRVVEAAFCDLTPAEKLCIEIAMGMQPDVWKVRDGVMESAVAKMERRMRAGALV